MRTLIKRALSSDSSLDTITIKGWVRTRRDSKEFSFLEMNDGSCLANIQCVADAGIPGYEDIAKMTTGAAVGITGKLVESPGKGQKWEIHATSVELIGEAPADYPLQKKGHTPEFLRSIAHLRPRANLYGAVFRMRSRMAQAVHRFFAERDFNYVHTPIITDSDCEGAGEMFRVTTLDPAKAEAQQFENDFFEKPTYLTVSGQLEGEAFATALSNIYTFGPTFRAENSNTTRHASEFWMIEPEMAFCDLQGDMDLAEEFTKYLVDDALNNSEGDLDIFARFVDKGLLERLKFVSEKPFQRVSYTEAVEILEKSGKKFDYKVEWGVNLQSEHERYLTEEHFKCPVTVYNYPKSVKPFYMRTNEPDEKGRETVTAMDVLVPGIGEIIGGAQREERMDVLQANMAAHNLSEEDYGWYLDLRKYGSCPHAGFGMGFERMLMFVTGMKNIRDVIPFARTPGSCEF
ncbi:asparagine--tRNA ligase [Verrucomicrobiaceae bacterium 5K15]|uniref:Asparagine--tRNA ligase n=1 Tax=Oceaniferula flava TaxID=2800421 RepID=A0AAE2SBA6_9BACT|nr:asparagine--tRNA ligase [Oceaniferula flavus]MBK1854287.1 asparagine--tRNA ligase [Oceaniferula flavus]MBM1135593.1 asparagine--tRNA ligase [Oceaniferula flavus]